MDIQTFISNYKEAFGERVELPIVFWYSETPVVQPEKINGCFFKCLSTVRTGKPVSLDATTISCGGGKFYTGFSEMPERVPNFVSLKEHYKQTPQQVLDFIGELGVSPAEFSYLNFSRMDRVDSWEDKEGLLFLATPDMLSGLTSWAWFDSNEPGAVTTQFGSGCSCIITQTVNENRINGQRTFLGGLNPSVRPHFDPGHLSFTIPVSRFRKMSQTMRDSCLYGTHAWEKVKKRITGEEVQP
ncbi:MAG: DUF169 domain-containing protein [Tannerellaceae bacterium]|nr:DUF169 domain-containing protein [Tannerellaceae bacterium]